MSNIPSRRLKKEHKIVLRALEIANTAHSRVVALDEIVAALSLSDEDIKVLKKTYDRELNVTVSKIIGQLRARNFIFSPGKIGKCGYYGTEQALAPEDRTLPLRLTRRRLVLELVRSAVTAAGRAVRIGDVFDFARSGTQADGLTNEEITHDVLSLKETGELRVIGSPLRKDDKGINLYLPSELDPAYYAPSEPLTWLDEVARAFKELWEERKQQAVAENRLPRPISTGEVRARLLASPQPHKNMQKSQPVVSAMITLSETDAAIVRKVKRKGQRASLWAPRDISEEIDIGDAFASDTERVGEAVKRAVGRLGRPVTVRDVKNEVNFDSALQPAGAANLYRILNDAAKQRIDKTKSGVLHKRTNRRFHRIGKANGEAYYWDSPEGLNDARFYVRLHQTKSSLIDSDPAAQLRDLEACAFPSIAVGRALLISTDTRRAMHALQSLLSSQHGSKEAREEAEALRATLRVIHSEVRRSLDSYSTDELGCPREVVTDTPTLAARELLSILKPLYPLATSIKDPNKLIRLLWGVVRRVPNPRFVYRFSKDPDVTSEFLFDRTDTLLYAAKQWGGRECALQAMMAGSQLGRLRDARFVFPVLNLQRFEERLIGVACLAFLQTTKAKALLRKIATEDNSPSVRQAALWACGFANVDRLSELLCDVINADPDIHVREFATIAINSDRDSWWFM